MEVIPTRRFTLRWFAGRTTSRFQAQVQAQLLDQVVQDQVLVQDWSRSRDPEQDQDLAEEQDNHGIWLEMSSYGSKAICTRIQFISEPFLAQEGS